MKSGTRMHNEFSGYAERESCCYHASRARRTDSQYERAKEVRESMVSKVKQSIYPPFQKHKRRILPTVAF